MQEDWKPQIERVWLLGVNEEGGGENMAAFNENFVG